MKKIILAAAIILAAPLHSETPSSTMLHQQQLTDEQLFAAQIEIFQQLMMQESSLQAIRLSNRPLVEKWQQFLQIVLPVQTRVVQTYSLSSDQSGISHFHQQYMQRAAQNTALFDLNKRKWLFLFEHAFGVTEYKDISLEEARVFLADIADQMTSESFLQKIDGAVANLGEGAGLVEKRKALLTELFPLHMSIMEKYGFAGEKGYIQAQRAFIDHYFDPQILECVNRAQRVVFQRAGLLS